MGDWAAPPSPRPTALATYRAPAPAPTRRPAGPETWLMPSGRPGAAARATGVAPRRPARAGRTPSAAWPSERRGRQRLGRTAEGWSTWLRRHEIARAAGVARRESGVTDAGQGARRGGGGTAPATIVRAPGGPEHELVCEGVGKPVLGFTVTQPPSGTRAGEGWLRDLRPRPASAPPARDAPIPRVAERLPHVADTIRSSVVQRAPGVG
eukprot:356915-Chlamydomonas_euryale.AAC.3